MDGAEQVEMKGSLQHPGPCRPLDFIATESPAVPRTVCQNAGFLECERVFEVLHFRRPKTFRLFEAQ